jgi:hypothetical protein
MKRTKRTGKIGTIGTIKVPAGAADKDGIVQISRAQVRDVIAKTKGKRRNRPLRSKG